MGDLYCKVKILWHWSENLSNQIVLYELHLWMVGRKNLLQQEKTWGLINVREGLLYTAAGWEVREKEKTNYGKRTETRNRGIYYNTSEKRRVEKKCRITWSSYNYMLYQKWKFKA